MESKNSTMALPDAPRKHKKSRTGCKNCKTRKVKCDEKRPICTGCYKYFANAVECEYNVSRKAHRDPAQPKRDVVCIRPAIVAIQPEVADEEIPRSPVLAGMSLDPFSTLHSCKRPNTQSLMQHYLSSFRTRSIPIVIGIVHGSVSKKWWSMANDDELLFQATLQLSAFDIDSLKGAKEPSRSTAQIGKDCVRLLRARIEEASDCISDSTIAAVLSLLIVEFERGNMKAVRMHVEGIKRMVNLRGGLTALRNKNVVLANSIYGTTTVVMAESQFPPDSGLPTTSLIRNDRCPPPIITDFESYGLSPSFAHAVRQFQYNVWMLETSSFTEAAFVCTGMWTQQLLHLPLPGEDEGLLTRSASDACRWACALASFLPFLNDYPNPQLYINSLTHKLRCALMDMLKVVPMDHGLLPWLLASGAVMALRPERKWFIDELVIVVDESNIRSWEDFRLSIALLVWSSFYCTKPFRKLWDEIYKQRLTLDE